jgi:hypothetical protein
MISAWHLIGPLIKLACCRDIIRGSQRLLKQEYYCLARDTRIIYPKPDLLPAAVFRLEHSRPESRPENEAWKECTRIIE